MPRPPRGLHSCWSRISDVYRSLWPTRVHVTCSMTAISCCRCIQPLTLEWPWLHVFLRSSCTLSVGCDVHHLVIGVGVLAMLVTRRRCSETVASASAATVAVVLVVLATRCHHSSNGLRRLRPRRQRQSVDACRLASVTFLSTVVADQRARRASFSSALCRHVVQMFQHLFTRQQGGRPAGSASWPANRRHVWIDS